MPEVLTTVTFSTKLGPMFAAASSKGLAALDFTKPQRDALFQRRKERWFPNSRFEAGRTDILDAADAWLKWYFDRVGVAPKVPLDQRGTEFELAVWRAMVKIPFGKTASYGDLARAIGKDRSARAVGMASGRNPLGIIVPCHRVIGTNGALTGYGGGIETKKWLLDHERLQD